MSRYYELASAPGTRIGDINRQSQWAYLDDPKIQEKLLDYAGEGRGKMTLHLPAIHCVACVWLLENLFRLLPGIRESRVNFLRREVAVTFAREQVKPSEIAALLTSLGYEPQLTFGELERVAERSAPHHRRQWLQLGVAGFGFGNAMLLALPGYLGLDSASGPWFRIFAGWLGLGLALPVLVYSAGDYWRAARLSFKQRVLTLDVPIALGLAAIYAQSVFEVFSKREGYADSLTGLIFFLLCGRAFQQKTFARLAFDRDYKGFFPLSVVRKTEEKAEPVAISQVATGDRLLIRHGELVPADARLAAGEALIDYSFVTGESEPISRKTGETLYAGGRQISGAIEIETIKPVSESYLTSLWNSEAFHKQDGDDLDSLTNRYSKRFTAVVVAAAIGAGTFWLFSDATMALKAVTSVLIVACPCALALAAPLTLGTALRALAARGLFLRNAQVVERMAAADVIAFDKTGTLTTTEGGEAVWKGAPLSDGEAGDVRSLAQHSAHPLARRIEQTLPSSRCDGPVRTFLEIPGRGMRGSLGSSEILLGSGPWLQSCGIPDVLMNANQGVDSAVSAGSVHLAINGRYRGQFVLEGVLRPEVESLVRALQKTHQIILLSGDNSREKGRFSELLGAGARIEFNQSPFDKLRAIEELQNAGHKVMMVGDGLNDAGALKQADVGVAVVERTGAFSPASDVILEASQLPQLARSLRFSTQATRIVRLGFVLSGLYNVVGITIAAAGLLSPLVCAVLMPLSSATVVLFSAGTTRWAARRTLGSRASATVGGQASNLGALEGRRNAAASKRLRHPQSLSIAPNTKEAVS